MKEKDLREVRHLFGDLIVRTAQATDPAELDLTAGLMDRVHDGADALLVMRGNRVEQHRYIQALPFDVRLVLCMWLMDTDLSSKLMRVVYANH